MPQPRQGVVMDIMPVRKVAERDYSQPQRVAKVAPASVIQDVIVQEAPTLVAEPVAVAAPVETAPVPSLTDVERHRVVRHVSKHTKKVHRKDRRRRWYDFIVHRVGLYIIAGLLLAATAYVGITTMLTNQRVQTQAPAASVSAGAAVAPTDATQEGADKTPLPANSLANYHVAADLPRALYINKINVAARTIPMSVNNDGSVQAPINIFDSGWYTGSVKPGEVGAMFIDGHSSGDTHEGLFGNLDKLAVGDTMQVEKGNGDKLTYKVVHTEVVALKDVDMKKMLLPYGNALRGLNMMTCTGQWVTTNGQHTLDKRILVFTEQV